MKVSHMVLIAGGLVVAADAIAGIQAAKNVDDAGSPVLPGWFSSSLGTIENAVPVPLGLSLLVVGGVLLFFFKK